MHIAATVFALVILATGIFYGQKVVDTNNNPDKEESREVLSITEEDDKDVKGVDDTKKEENITAIPTLVIEETSTPQPTVNISSDIQLQTYKYPNSSVINSGSNSLNLQSDASPKLITDWYKETINSNGFNVTSFVTTSTNDNVLNKLAAAKSGQNIEVEIEKKSGESKTSVKVTLF